MSRILEGVSSRLFTCKFKCESVRSCSSTMVVEEIMDKEPPLEEERAELQLSMRTHSSTEACEQESEGLLSQLLMIDEQLTISLGSCAQPQTPLQKVLKVCCMCLELSGHGVPWFTLSGLILLLYTYTGHEHFLCYGLNLLCILVMDIVVVAPIKILFKRPRPILNNGLIPMSMLAVDSYAFPSGHASRCVALAALFCYLPPFYLHTHLWYIWAVLVSLSRVAIGRHHVLDVGAGIIAGLIIFDLVRRFGLLMGV